MEPKDEKSPEFPVGFEHVRERLHKTMDRLQQINDQIKNIPKEQGPTFKYEPPNFVGRVIPGSRDKTRITLEKTQHELKMETLSKTETDTRYADNKVGRVVRDNVRESLFPNPYRQVTQEDRLDDKGTHKDIEQSQDYMDAKLVRRAAERKEREDGKQTLPDQNRSSRSMSARFSMSLNYTKIIEKSDEKPAPSRDRQIDKDRD